MTSGQKKNCHKYKPFMTIKIVRQIFLFYLLASCAKNL